MKFATKLLHAGIEPDASTGAIMTPIFQTSTYVQAARGSQRVWIRTNSKPTWTVLKPTLPPWRMEILEFVLLQVLLLKTQLWNFWVPEMKYYRQAIYTVGHSDRCAACIWKYGIKSTFVNLSDRDTAIAAIKKELSYYGLRLYQSNA